MSKKKILLIENDEENRELMRTSLEQDGYEVVIAADGVRGFDKALFVRPDLIVTGVRIPGADGMHVLRRVRSTAVLENTPVLITTAFGTGDGTFSLQLGASALEPKPINSQNFLSTVKRLLDKKRAA
jgi:CheY-like chemotaxis protein